MQHLMEELEASGTAQARKIYANHGVGANQFGVSTAALRAIAKRVKRDHAAAQFLWASGNHDARCLACLLADPAQATESELEAWVRDLDNYIIGDAFSGYVTDTPHAHTLYPRWITADDEWMEYAGWNVLGSLVYLGHPVPDDIVQRYLLMAEQHVHTAKNRVRHAMNAYIINVGLLDEPLRSMALETAERVGDVEVNHGKTSCETPNAKAYILKTLDYRASKAAKAKTKKV